MTGIFLRATAVTRGWNGYRNKSQHRKSTLEKKILPPFQQGFEPATFQSRVRCSNHWAIPAPRGGGGGISHCHEYIYVCVISSLELYHQHSFEMAGYKCICIYIYIASHLKAMLMVKFEGGSHTPSIGFRHLPPKGGCRKPVLGVWWEASHCLAVYCAWSINTEIPRSKGDNFKTKQSRLKWVGR